jgi:hypothetical protein
VREAVESPDVQQRLQALGVRAQASTPQALGGCWVRRSSVGAA